MPAFRYVLELDCDAQAGSVTWTNVEGEVVRNSAGGRRFSAEGDGTRVDYQATLQIEAPLTGLILRKIVDRLVTLSLPAMFASVEGEARKRSGS
jgi:hypothetical protein